MRKIFKSWIFSFILGAITFGFIGVMASNLLSGNIIYKNNVTVEDAIDDLYDRAKPVYSGTTTYTPSSSTQTVPTNNKILNSNITINPIPSTYKTLSTTTTVTANKLYSGRTAYNSNGTLITGTLSTNCVSGRFYSDSTTAGSTDGYILAPFKANYIYFYGESYGPISFYHKNKSTTTMYQITVSGTFTTNSNPASYFLVFDSDKTVLRNAGDKFVDTYIQYMACK